MVASPPLGSRRVELIEHEDYFNTLLILEFDKHEKEHV